MGNLLYTKAKEGFLEGTISWMTNDIRAILIDASAYTANLTTDSYLSDIPVGARTATSGNLTSKSVVNGVADADDTTFSAVSGVQSEIIVLYKHTGNEATSILIAYIDTSTGLPITPTGEDIIIVWDNSTNKIFKL